MSIVLVCYLLALQIGLLTAGFRNLDRYPKKPSRFLG